MSNNVGLKHKHFKMITLLTGLLMKIVSVYWFGIKQIQQILELNLEKHLLGNL